MSNNYNVDLERKYKTYFFLNGVRKDIVANLYEYIGYQMMIIMKEKNLTKKQVLERSGFSQLSVLSRIKQGKHSFKIDTILKLCKGLDCKSNELLPF